MNESTQKALAKTLLVGAAITVVWYYVCPTYRVVGQTSIMHEVAGYAGSNTGRPENYDLLDSTTFWIVELAIWLCLAAAFLYRDRLSRIFVFEIDDHPKTPAPRSVAREQLLAAFKAVNDRSPDGIMACWERDGVYDNPMVGQAAEGFEPVRLCMVNLVDSLASKNQTLVVDRVTVGEANVIAEWHVEPHDGRRGVHVAEFSLAGKLKRVTVYPRAN